jgi:hypothetical protein
MWRRKFAFADVFSLQENGFSSEFEEPFEKSIAVAC